jgi:hypothetical protein
MGWAIWHRSYDEESTARPTGTFTGPSLLEF